MKPFKSRIFLFAPALIVFSLPKACAKIGYGYSQSLKIV
jgi:hypothetical protein